MECEYRFNRWFRLKDVPEPRGIIDEYFRNLKSDATSIKDWQLGHVGDLGKCLAFDAITACEVFSFERLVRDRSQTLTAEVLSEGDTIGAGHPTGRLWHPPPGESPYIRSFVVDMVRLTGLQPRRSQVLPGIMKLWEEHVLLQDSTLTYSLSRLGAI